MTVSMTVFMAAPTPIPSPPPGSDPVSPPGAVRPQGPPPGLAPGGATAGRSALEVVLPAVLISVALVATAAITIIDYYFSSVGPVVAAVGLVLGGEGTWVLVTGIVLCLRRRAVVGASASLLAVVPLVLADWSDLPRTLMGVLLIAVPLLIALLLSLASPPREEPRPVALQLSQGAVVVLVLDPVVFFINTLHALMGYPAYPHNDWEFHPDPPGAYVGSVVVLLLGIGALVAARLRRSRLLHAGLVTAQAVIWAVLSVMTTLRGGFLGEYVAGLLVLVLALLVWTRPVGRWFAGTWAPVVGRPAGAVTFAAPAPVAPYAAPQQILGADGRMRTVAPARAPGPWPMTAAVVGGAPVPNPVPGPGPGAAVPYAVGASPEASAQHAAAAAPAAAPSETPGAAVASGAAAPHTAAARSGDSASPAPPASPAPSAASGAPVSDEAAAPPETSASS